MSPRPEYFISLCSPININNNIYVIVICAYKISNFECSTSLSNHFYKVNALIIKYITYHIKFFYFKFCEFPKTIVRFTRLNNIIVFIAGVEFAREGELCDISASFPCKILAVLLAVQM